MFSGSIEEFSMVRVLLAGCWLGVVVSAAFATETHPAAETPLAQAGRGICVSAELIYSLDDRPTPQCHASTIAETKSGMVAAWFAGTHEKKRG